METIVKIAWIALFAVCIVELIRAVVYVVRRKRGIRAYHDAINEVSVGHLYRKTVRDFDADPWSTPAAVHLRVEEIRYTSNGEKWCRCVTAEDAGEVRLTAEELIDEYERYE